MKLKELFSDLLFVQKKMHTSVPLICGGAPRDRVIGNLEKLSDIDLTTGDSSIHLLSQEFFNFLRKKYNVTNKIAKDGHFSIFIGNVKLDFSANFNILNIDNLLIHQGIKNPTSMQKEMFSRDFTCNSLLLSLDLKNTLDPTGKGFKDIEEKKIKTCLDPKITLTSYNNRVIRAIYLAAKLGFNIDDGIIKFVQSDPSSVKLSSAKSLLEKTEEAFRYDADRSSYYVSKMGLWDYIPITEKVSPYYEKYSKSKMLPSKQAYFQGTENPKFKEKQYNSDPAITVQPRFIEPLYHNYDLYYTEGVNGEPKHSPGSGFYQNMHEFKSVKDFRNNSNLKKKYIAEDTYITDENKEDRIRRMKIRSKLLSSLVKLAIDFPVDDTSNKHLPGEGGPILGDHGIGDLLPFGNQTSPLLTENDIAGKSVDKLNFSQNLEDEYILPSEKLDVDPSIEDQLNDIMKKYVKRTDLFGLPDGIPTDEKDEDVDFYRNPWGGIEETQTAEYDKKPY